MSNLSTSQDVIAEAMGRVPSGCAILTASHDGKSTGMLASWFQQVSFEPMAVSVCVKPRRPIATLIAGSGRFVLNVLDDDAKVLLTHFGRGFGLDEPAFKGVGHLPSDFGPVLSDGAVAALACAVQAVHSCGDHDLYVGRVEQASGQPEAAPFIHLRKSGAGY